MKLLAKTFHGLEDILVKELEQLGVKHITLLKRAVSFEASKEQLYKANLQLRTALRILQPIFIFKANNEQELYKQVVNYNWHAYLTVNQTLAIDSVVFSEQFTHSQYVALKVKDGIVDYFRNKEGRRPNIDTKNPDVLLNVHVAGTKFTVSIDSSGQPLFKRGYRKESPIAPLNECLAAGMILLTNWNKSIPFIDPMCGSGTLPIEAAMIGSNLPACINRKEFGFMKWKNYDPELWTKIRNEAIEKIDRSGVRIFASDISNKAVEIAKKSIIRMGFEKEIQLIKIPIENYSPQIDKGVLVINPPYGERLKQNEINNLYKKIGDHLKNKYTGFDAWIISSNTEALKHIGLKPSKKITLFNGALECKFQKFSLYKGSKKKF